MPPGVKSGDMGFLKPAAETKTIDTVATGIGRADVLGVKHPKSRLWILADRTAVLVVPADPGQRNMVRLKFDVDASSWDKRTKVLALVTPDGDIVSVDGGGGGCTPCQMGRVANAGPVEGQYRVARVRTPAWHTVS